MNRSEKLEVRSSEFQRSWKLEARSSEFGPRSSIPCSRRVSEFELSAVGSAKTDLLSSAQRAPRRAVASRSGGFTLIELLVSMAVLAILVLLFARIMSSAATITTLGHKRMDSDSQARQLLDRMQIDFDQMLKRRDVSYFVKTGSSQPGNDQIAFFTAGPGYYRQTGYRSDVTLVSYRINASSSSTSYNRMERMGKGLHFNAYAGVIPLLFLDGATPPPAPGVPTPLSNTTISAIWPAAVSPTLSDTPAPGDYEVAGPQVFRFEYYYLLTPNGPSGLSGVSGGPWANPNSFVVNDVAAIVVNIAVIDPKSKVLLTDSQISTLAATLVDYTSGWTPGQLLSTWQTALDGITNMPRPAIQGIRLYERYYYLSQ
jgi:prepilin-type N-terminal cleavage/methylation domain-containing protein